MSGLAERVKEAREAAGISQSELARRIGIKPQSVQSIESGGSKGSRHIVALAAALGREPEWLQFGESAPPRDAFSARFKVARDRLGLSQEELAKRLGVKQATVSRWENGQRDPDFDALNGVAAALETSVGDLLGETASPAPNGHAPATARLILEIRQEVTPDQAKRIFEILNETK